MIKNFDEFINENIFDGIGKRSKGGIVRKEDEVKSVDLGLPSGTILAACNLGASSPEEYGYYYAWGETEPKDKYSWNNYKFGTENNFTKYNYEDGKTILDPEDDAAHVILGGKWHMPTKEQIQELIDNTTNEESKFDGVRGRLFTSKINGNKLFFPYSGGKGSSIGSSGYVGKYWSSSINKSLPNYSIILYTKFNDYRINFSNRCNGYSVRAVLDKK